MTKAPAFNRELGLKINREIWNARQFDKIAEYFSEAFVSDYSPNFVRHGRHHVQEAVERAHATFEGFREEIKTIVADDETRRGGRFLALGKRSPSTRSRSRPYETARLCIRWA